MINRAYLNVKKDPERLLFLEISGYFIALFCLVSIIILMWFVHSPAKTSNKGERDVYEMIQRARNGEKSGTISKEGRAFLIQQIIKNGSL